MTGGSVGDGGGCGSDVKETLFAYARFSVLIIFFLGSASSFMSNQSLLFPYAPSLILMSLARYRFRIANCIDILLMVRWIVTSRLLRRMWTGAWWRKNQSRYYFTNLPYQFTFCLKKKRSSLTYTAI